MLICNILSIGIGRGIAGGIPLPFPNCLVNKSSQVFGPWAHWNVKIHENSRVFGPRAGRNDNSRVFSPWASQNENSRVFSPGACRNENSRDLKNLNNLRLLSMHSRDLSWQFPKFHSEYKCQAIFETCWQEEFEIKLCPSSDIELCYKSLWSKTCSLSVQNLVTFFIDSLIHSLIDSLIIWTTAKYF